MSPDPRAEPDDAPDTLPAPPPRVTADDWRRAEELRDDAAEIDATLATVRARHALPPPAPSRGPVTRPSSPSALRIADILAEGRRAAGMPEEPTPEEP